MIIIASALHAEENHFGINFTGFVKTDIFYDSRANESFREGHFYLYPLEKAPDENGNDLNAKGDFNILSIQSRLTGKITGPDALGAKTSGMIEGAFFGSAEGNINTFRLRHAILKLDWDNTQLMIGQYWHPLFVTECFPAVVNFNTGAPFEPFSRNPQVRVTQKLGNISLLLAAASQRDFTSTGPEKGSSSYLRNALIPDMNLRLSYKSTNILLGAGGEYKMLMPRTYTSITNVSGIKENFKTDELVGGFAVNAFVKYSSDNFIFKLYGIYGQNLTNMTMLGGYALKKYNPQTGFEEYTPTNLFSTWTEFIYGKKLQVGLFAGYTKNMGTADNVFNGFLPVGLSLAFTRGYRIDNIIRISPRLIWNTGKVRLAAELEYTAAAYGTPDITDKLKVKDKKVYANIRPLLAAYLFF